MRSMSDQNSGYRQNEPGNEPETCEALRIDRRLLEILVCPLTKSTLHYDPLTQELFSAPARLCYPIKDGIPILLPYEGRRADP